MKNLSHKKQKGFTLLFAVLLSSLIISIGATIMSIALRQTLLSGTTRESQYAFYAANTVLECAFYWDTIGTQPAKPSDSGIVFPADIDSLDEELSSDLSDVTCAGVNISSGDGGIQGVWDIAIPNKTTFKIEISDPLHAASYCAEATVTKSNGSSPGLIKTRIEAKGYNTCVTTNSRRVERGLVQEYES